MNRIGKLNLLFCSLLLNLSPSWSQGLSDHTVKKIDSLLLKWDGHMPGVAVGVVKGDSLVFAKGYGMANLEYDIPISADTRFYIASVSKQFTGYCTTLLARQNKLNIKDDIRLYLPWFPDLKEKITIENLLTHTSGIRDHLNMIAISGLGIDGTLTNEFVLKTLEGQQALNFPPGERYSYSNSNYILLAEIINVVSGKTLREFADSAIFKPLKMTKTHYHDNASELIEDRAVSYRQTAPGAFSNAFHNVNTVGDGGVFTTLGDASKWIGNFFNPVAGDVRDIEALTKTGYLSTGKKMSYASGIRVSEELGWKVYTHGGALHAYRATMSIFPELKTGIIVFANTTVDVHGLAREVARFFIAPKKSSAQRPPKGSEILEISSSDAKLLKTFQGDFISEDGYLLRMEWRNGSLSGSGFGQSFELTGKEKANVFHFPSVNNPLTMIVLKEGTNERQFDLEFPDEVLHFTRLNDSIAIDPEDVTGEYYSAELDCIYRIVLRDGQLFLSNLKYPDSKLTLRETHLKKDSWFMNHMKIVRDQKKIVGFDVNSGNVMHLRFMKVR